MAFKNQNYHYLNKIWNVNCDSFQLSYSVGTFIHYKNMHSKLHFLDKSDNLRCPECRFPRPLMSIHPRPPYWRLCTGPGSPLEHWGCYHWTASWNWRVHLFRRPQFQWFIKTTVHIIFNLLVNMYCGFIGICKHHFCRCCENHIFKDT